MSDSRCNVYLCWQRISDLMPANKPLHNSSQPVSQDYLFCFPPPVTIPKTPRATLISRVKFILSLDPPATESSLHLFVVYSISLSIIEVTGSIFLHLYICQRLEMGEKNQSFFQLTWSIECLLSVPVSQVWREVLRLVWWCDAWSLVTCPRCPRGYLRCHWSEARPHIPQP